MEWPAIVHILFANSLILLKKPSKYKTKRTVHTKTNIGQQEFSIYKEYLKLQNRYLILQLSCLSIYKQLKKLCMEYQECKAYRE